MICPLTTLEITRQKESCNHAQIIGEQDHSQAHPVQISLAYNCPAAMYFNYSTQCYCVRQVSWVNFFRIFVVLLLRNKACTHFLCTSKPSSISHVLLCVDLALASLREHTSSCLITGIRGGPYIQSVYWLSYLVQLRRMDCVGRIWEMRKVSTKDCSLGRQYSVILWLYLHVTVSAFSAETSRTSDPQVRHLLHSRRRAHLDCHFCVAWIFVGNNPVQNTNFLRFDTHLQPNGSDNLSRPPAKPTLLVTQKV